MGSHKPLHKQYFATNRRLWLSVIPEEGRKKFPRAENATPGFLVTSSVFARKFWNEPKVALTSVMKNLTPDRAWFGIRSLIKGSKIADDVKVNGLKNSHFRQLDGESDLSQPQLSKSSTEKYYSDDDLRTLVEIYKKYDKWIKEQNYYDEMDIVRTARSHLSKPIDEPLPSKNYDKNDTAQIITQMDMTVESVEFKQDAISKIYSKNMTHEMYEKLEKFVNKWLETKTARGYHSQKTKSGVILYKMRLNRDARMIFSVTVVDGKNAKIIKYDKQSDPVIEYKPILFIYDLCFNHDEQKAWYTKNLNEIQHPQDDSTEIDISAEISMVKRMSQTPGQGPTKTLPKKLSPVIDTGDENLMRTARQDLDDLDQPYNISLDYHQKEAIIRNQPLLIDGLAGTGKTAVLARRGVFRAGFSKDSTRILYLASTDAVVQRLVSDTSAQLNKVEYWKDRHKQEFLTEFIGVHNEYEKTSSDLTINQFAEQSHLGFDEIILDECQDITELEFECLKSFAYSQDSQRFTFAGDPLQTLNPTGFDWARIKAMFTESMFSTEEERNKNASQIGITKFHQNYRSQSNVVRFANAVQAHRAKLVGNVDDMITMEAMLEPKSQPYLVQINDSEDKETLMKAITESGLHNVVTICWAADDNQIINLCSDSGDKILNQVWQNKIEDDPEVDKYSFRKGVTLHSSTSIKGDEKHSVMLYKFGSSHNGLLDSLMTNQEELQKIPQTDLISVSFAYSRLYVAITRPFSNIYIVEDEEGIDFWRNAQLADEKGNLLDLWGEDGKLHVGKEILAGADFLIDEEMNHEKLVILIKKWNKSKNIIDGETAIRIAKHLGRLEDVYEIEGDMIKMKAEDLPVGSEGRKELLQEAINRYKLAKRPRKFYPIMYELEQWRELEGMIYKVKGKPFERIMTIFCKIKRGDMSNQSVPEIKSIYNDITAINYTNCDWEDWNNSSKIGEFKEVFNKAYLDILTQNTVKMSGLIDEVMIREFGFENIRSRLEKWVESYPGMYLDLTENYATDNYNTKNDNFYGKALMSRYEEYNDNELEQKRIWINKNIGNVDEDSKEILNNFQFDNLASLIDLLPKSQKDYRQEKNGFPTFAKKFDPKQKVTELDQTEKLFFYLRESIKYSSEEKFKPKYGGGLLLLMNLDLSDIYGWGGQFEDIIYSFKRIICDNNVTLSRKDQTSWINIDMVANVLMKLLLTTSYNRTRGPIVEVVKEAIFEGKPVNKHNIDEYVFDIVFKLNGLGKMQDAPWLDIFSKDFTHYSDLDKLTIDLIEKHNYNFERCMQNQIGGASWLKIKEFYHLYIEYHFHSKTTDLDENMLKTITLQNFWDDSHQKMAKIVGFHHTKEGQNLLALLSKKDINIDSTTLQPYIDMLRKANVNNLADDLTKRIKLDVQDARDKLMKTTDAENWLDYYQGIKPNISNKDKLLTTELLIDLLEKSDYDMAFTMDDKLLPVWTDFLQQNKNKSGFGLLTKILDNLSIQKSLQIYKIAPSHLCGLAIASSINRIEIISDYKDVFNHMLMQNIMDATSANRLQPINQTTAQMKKQSAKTKNLEDLLNKTVNKKLLPFESILVWVLNNLTTKVIDDLKDELEISGGSHKANKIKRIIEFIKIEWNEEFDQIIELSK